MTATPELRPVINLTDEFYQLCHNNPDIKLERNKGELIVMPPTGWGRVSEIPS